LPSLGVSPAKAQEAPRTNSIANNAEMKILFIATPCQVIDNTFFIPILFG
jgi:hypothetical protein